MHCGKNRYRGIYVLGLFVDSEGISLIFSLEKIVAELIGPTGIDEVLFILHECFYLLIELQNLLFCQFYTPVDLVEPGYAVIKVLVIVKRFFHALT
jgi:hypothetical protein